MQRIFNVLILMLGLFAGAESFAEEAAEWKFEKEEDGVKVYTRAVSGYSIREFRAVAAFAAEVDQLLNIYLDASKCVAWVPDCKYSEIHYSAQTQDYTLYRAINNPWPFKDMDYVLAVHVERQEGGGAVINFHDIAAEQTRECCNRIKQMKGYWQFKQLPSGLVEVTYQNHFVPAGKVPAGMINSALPNFPIDKFARLRKLLQSA